MRRPGRRPGLRILPCARLARQVGKSTLVHQFASARGLALNEINLERHLNLAKVFRSLDLPQILEELSVLVGRSVDAPGTLLFLNEIQAVPEALVALRYFYEDRPDLPVVAAGSLKSLRELMLARRFSRALRFDLNRPSSQTVAMAAGDGTVAYRLDSLPLYSVPFL